MAPTEVARPGPSADGRSSPTVVSVSAQADLPQSPRKADFQSAHGGGHPGQVVMIKVVTASQIAWVGGTRKGSGQKAGQFGSGLIGEGEAELKFSTPLSRFMTWARSL